MDSFYKNYKNFTKSGIVFFVLLTTGAGYFLSLSAEASFSFVHFFLTLLGTYLLSSGSLGLNQVQELEMDSKMDRTQMRPLVSGRFSKSFGLNLSLALIVVGLFTLWFVSIMSFTLGLATVILYNGFYTLYWKPNWSFGAVPGALPGSLPVVIGYAANPSSLFDPEIIYGFLILFLWQMPHFWALAIKYQDDYKKADFPVLPVKLGNQKTLFHMFLYLVVYLALAIHAPMFIDLGLYYWVFILPFVGFLGWSFFQYARDEGNRSWLRFFLGVNFSLLAFLFVPVIARWQWYYERLYYSIF